MRLLWLIGSVTLESVVSAILTILLFDPIGSLDLDSCGVDHCSSGYARDSVTTIHGTSKFYVSRYGAEKTSHVCEFDVSTLQVRELSVTQVGKMYIDRKGRLGVDTAIQVLDLENSKVITCFGDVKRPQMRQNPQTYPKISPDGEFVAWLLVHEARVRVASVQQRAVIGQAFVHSTPLSIRFCVNNILAVGAEEGHICTFDIITSESDAGDVMTRHELQSNQNKKAELKENKTQEVAKKSSMCALL